MISERSETVPAVKLIVAGIVCSAGSKLNLNRFQNVRCIRDGTQKTGETASGLVDYVAVQKPPVVLIENTPTLDTKDETGISNFDDLVAMFHALGYIFISTQIRAEMLGIPCSRDRLYMIAILDSDQTLDEAVAQQNYNDLMEHLNHVASTSFPLRAVDLLDTPDMPSNLGTSSLCIEPPRKSSKCDNNKWPEETLGAQVSGDFLDSPSGHPSLHDMDPMYGSSWAMSGG